MIFIYIISIFDKEDLSVFKQFGKQVTLIPVENVCDHALSPRVFFYKVYAIWDCMHNRSESFIYSDSANCFIREATNIHNDLIDDSLFLAYPYERLTNKYWVTKECFSVIGSFGAEMMPQYWAGFQAYNRTKENLRFVQEMYDYMLDPRVALPDTTIKRPDGNNSPCIEHRQDQAVLSILIHKNFRHQNFNISINSKYGDWQTFRDFDSSYRHDFDKMILSPRESKFGKFRFLNV